MIGCGSGHLVGWSVGGEMLRINIHLRYFVLCTETDAKNTRNTLNIVNNAE